MIELGELEERATAFRERGVRLICISLDDRDGAGEIQRRFPSLTILADARRDFAEGMKLVQRAAGPQAADGLAPTTILLDEGAIVRWLYRPPNLADRLSPDALFEAIDRYLPR